MPLQIARSDSDCEAASMIRPTIVADKGILYCHISQFTKAHTSLQLPIAQKGWTACCLLFIEASETQELALLTIPLPSAPRREIFCTANDEQLLYVCLVRPSNPRSGTQQVLLIGKELK